VPVLASVRSVSHSFGARPLFESVSFTLSDSDRVGLIGPNGAGKSTLLKILAGSIAPDRGDVQRRSGARIAYLAQVPELDGRATVREVVKAGLLAVPHASGDDEARVEEWVNRLELMGDAVVGELSGGGRKRVALAAALVSEPELLLLDEPTNHLDVESIMALERLLGGARFATLTVTHDRLFLQRVSNRILELDRRNAGGLLDVAGDYATYVEQKAERMAAQEKREEKLRNTLRRETEWLRRGAAARSTKQRARIQRAEALGDEVAELTERNRVGSVGLDFQSGDSANERRRLIEARSATKRYGDELVLEGIDLLVTPRTRLGLLGPNGCGKTTLLRVLTGDEAPTSGSVFRADGLQVAYFEQNRATLDPERTAAETVCPEGDYVAFRGSHLHKHGYLERFLFRADQMAQPVRSLSGGEQSRLLLARLMLEPADVLVLDEPTNDLDLPTLMVLEEALESFEGAVLLVTHDRYFLDQVATDLLAFHTAPGERGRVTGFAGLAQWEAWYGAQRTGRTSRAAGKTAGGGGKTESGGDESLGADTAGSQPKAPAKRKKLSFNDQRDFDTIESRILAAEARLAELTAECAKPDVVSNAPRLVELDAQMTTTRGEIDRLYARWAELSGKLEA
jgi:ATP-binding cassette subfamily F protein uup